MKLTEINPGFLKTVTKEDLLDLHGLLHEIYGKSVQKALGVSSDGGALSKPEIGEIQIKIQDIDEYVTKDIADEQLVIDWEITCGWYSTIKEDKKGFKFTEEQIVELAKKIYKEMIKRNFTFKPVDNKKWDGKLFEIVSDKKVEKSEKEFWEEIYEGGEAHWTDKKPSNLTKQIVDKYGMFDRILEIGCGAGIDTFLLSKITNKEIIGIDIVEDAIKLAKDNLKKVPEKIRNKIKFETGDVENLKYKDNKFDFVYSLSVLHSTDVSKSLKEIHRVLNDAGKAVIYVFIGEGKDKVDKKLFLDTCKKYFDITDQEKVKVESDKAGDEHTALIVYLDM